MLKYLPAMMLPYKVVTPFVSLPGFPPEIRQVIARLGGIVEIQEEDVMSIMKMPGMSEQFGMIGRNVDDEHFEELFGALGRLPSVCAKFLAPCSCIKKLIGDVDLKKVCERTDINTLGENMMKLTMMNYKMEGKVDMKTLFQFLPMLQQIVNVLEPFRHLSGFDSRLGEVVDSLKPVIRVSSGDNSTHGILREEKLYKAFMGFLMNPNVQRIGKGMLKGVAKLPSACGNETLLSNIPQLHEMFENSNTTELCMKPGLEQLGYGARALVKLLTVEEEPEDKDQVLETCHKKFSRMRNETDEDYIPQCKEDGNYTMKQCNKRQEYCWCVDPDTGEYMNNTKELSSVPLNCDIQYAKHMLPKLRSFY
jgi:hypothetical protein